MSAIAYLSLGSNLGNRAAHLRSALLQLETAGRPLAVSALYETQPVDVTHQPWFLNCMLALETDLTPRELFQRTLRIETDMGRLRIAEKAARIIDIDIALFGDLILHEPDLTIPHPAMHRRRFVLQPLVEIAPQALHPELLKTARELLQALPEGQTVQKFTSAL